MLVTLVALAFAAPQTGAASRVSTAPSRRTDVETQNAPRLATAAQLLRDRQPQQALEVVTTALSAYDADLSGEKRRLYCRMSGPETLLYLAMAAKDKVSAVALAPGYCEALFMKGFALVDLGRPAEARAVYERLATLAPMHAHYLTELGQLARVEKDWPGMLSTCERAAGAAALATPDTKVAEQTAALRCQGYALVEEHRLDKAEQRYRDALKLDPRDVKSIGELRYIAQQRADVSRAAARAPRTP